MTVKSTAGAHGSLAASQINTSHYVPRYFTVAQSGLVAGNTITADFSYGASDISSGTCNSSFKVARFGTSWSYLATSNSTSASSPLLAYASTVSGLTGTTVAADYVAGSTKTGAIVGSASVLLGNTATYTDTTAGGTWSSSSTSVATISASGVLTPLTTGSTTVSYSNSNGVRRTSPFLSMYTVSWIFFVGSCVAIADQV